jgi:peptide-methionine (S)-S-oxide reductase
MFLFKKKTEMPSAESALPGRSDVMPLREPHHVYGKDLRASFAALPAEQMLMVGMGCFWGAERKFWQMPGVITTAVGYAAGFTPNPSYREVCSGQTGHNETVLIGFDAQKVGLDELLRVFFESHDPTQGMRQGNDSGTQYRSGIYCYTAEQFELSQRMRDQFQIELKKSGFGVITTEIIFPAPPFYFAETEHQQYLSKNPGGYCGLGGTGVACRAGAAP